MLYDYYKDKCEKPIESKVYKKRKWAIKYGIRKGYEEIGYCVPIRYVRYAINFQLSNDKFLG